MYHALLKHQIAQVSTRYSEVYMLVLKTGVKFDKNLLLMVTFTPTNLKYELIWGMLVLNIFVKFHWNLMRNKTIRAKPAIFYFLNICVKFQQNQIKNAATRTMTTWVGRKDGQHAPKKVTRLCTSISCAGGHNKSFHHGPGCPEVDTQVIISQLTRGLSTPEIFWKYRSRISKNSTGSLT